MRAAVTALKDLEPKEVVVAVPSAARDSAESLRGTADKVIAVATPEPYMAVGAWYEKFGQTGDDEFKEILTAARKR